MDKIRNIKELERVLAENPNFKLNSTWRAGINQFGKSYWLYDDVECVMVDVDGRAGAAWEKRNNG